MKALLLAQSDRQGGASKAAFRLLKALQKEDLHVHLKVGKRMSNCADVSGSPNFIGNAAMVIVERLSNLILRFQFSEDENSRSTGLFGICRLASINESQWDVINVHWIGGGFLSILTVNRLKKPLVLTLHDMWAITGTEHYAEDTSEARWRAGYLCSNRIPDTKGIDVDRYVYRLKRQLINKQVQVVCPSQWLADCAKESPLFADHQVYTIPNPLNLEIFAPIPMPIARKACDLPLERKIILYGAAKVLRDKRKGFDLFLECMRKFHIAHPEVLIVVFGDSEGLSGQGIAEKNFILRGHVGSEKDLALLYSSADVMVVPSRIDNLPQTGTEAQACGCPVIAFDVGGLGDVVQDGVTGMLVRPFDTDAMAIAIADVLMPERQAAFRPAARKRAQALWAESVVAEKYKRVLETASTNYRG